MGRKQYLYHATTPENAKSILREGLLRKNGFCVYMSESPTAWLQPGLVVLKVRITGLKDLHTFGSPGLDEILCFEDIPPQRISKWEMPRRLLQKMAKMAKEEHAVATDEQE